MLTEIADLIRTKFARKSGIVYCLSRNECDEVAKSLKQSGIRAVAYHAGLKDEDRSAVQTAWINGRSQVDIFLFVFIHF